MDRNVVITGGNKGIGLGITKVMISSGARVFVLARNETEELKRVSDSIKFLKTDVSSFDSVQASFERISKLCTIDLLINNAGFSEWRPIKEIDEVFLTKIIDTNLKGYFWTAKACLQYFKKDFNIINISSIAGKRGSANNSAYCATKFGVNGLTQSLAKELGQHNIRVNAICPVLIKTDGLISALKSKFSPASPHSPDQFIKNFASTNSANGELPTAEDVGNLCLYLSSPESRSITGQCINLDCGVFPQ